MHQIQLDDSTYELAKQHADALGFKNVEDYIVDLVNDDDLTFETTPNLDHLVTPDPLSIIDQSLAELRAGGKTYTMEEVNEHLALALTDWIP